MTTRKREKKPVGVGGIKEGVCQTKEKNRSSIVTRHVEEEDNMVRCWFVGVACGQVVHFCSHSVAALYLHDVSLSHLLSSLPLLPPSLSISSCPIRTGKDNSSQSISTKSSSPLRG